MSHLSGYQNRFPASAFRTWPRLTMEDFRVGATYYTAQSVGVQGDGGDPEIFEEYFVLVPHQVGISDLASALLEFQKNVESGAAFVPAASTTTGQTTQGVTSQGQTTGPITTAGATTQPATTPPQTTAVPTTPPQTTPPQTTAVPTTPPVTTEPVTTPAPTTPPVTTPPVTTAPVTTPPATTVQPTSTTPATTAPGTTAPATTGAATTMALNFQNLVNFTQTAVRTVQATGASASAEPLEVFTTEGLCNAVMTPVSGGECLIEIVIGANTYQIGLKFGGQVNCYTNGVAIFTRNDISLSGGRRLQMEKRETIIRWRVVNSDGSTDDTIGTQPEVGAAGSGKHFVVRGTVTGDTLSEVGVVQV